MQVATTSLARPQKSRQRIDKEAVKEAAAGRWPEIFEALAGVPAETFNGRHQGCPVCGGKDRFRYIDSDKGGAICNQCFTTKNGDGLGVLQWLQPEKPFPVIVQEVSDYLGGIQVQTGTVTAKPVAAKAPARKEAPTPADPETMDKVYREYISQLPLISRHQQALRDRGLTDEAIERAGLKSIAPKLTAKPNLAVLTKFPGIKSRVPGLDRGAYAPVGILIPIRDQYRRIIAGQVRQDPPKDEQNKYVLLTNHHPEKHPNGLSPSAGYHVPLRKDGKPVFDWEEIRIVEGAFNAEVNNAILPQVPTVGLLGVNNIKPIQGFLLEHKFKRVILAPDADVTENTGVAEATIKLTEFCHEHKIDVVIERWDRETAKGRDDLANLNILPDTLVGDAVIEFIDELKKTTPVEEFGFEVITAAELDRKHLPIDYLIPGILVASQPAMIAGASKTLKTGTALDLAISLASGQPFLGEAEVTRPVKVGMFSGESGMPVLQETSRRICRQKGFSLGELGERFVLCDTIPKVKQVSQIDAFRSVIQDHKLEVVIVDPLYLSLDGADLANVFAMGEQLDIFGRMGKELGVTMVLLHHTRKLTTNASEYQPLELSDMSAAGVAEFARQWLLISRRSKYDPDSSIHQLWLSAGGSAGHSRLLAVDIDEGHQSDEGGRKWDVTVMPANEAKKLAAEAAKERREAAKETKREETQKARREKVKRAFLGNPVLTSRELRDLAGFSADAAREIIAYMLRIGEMEKTVTTKNGREYEALSMNWKNVTDS